jgi:hypothetical protein
MLPDVILPSVLQQTEETLQTKLTLLGYLLQLDPELNLDHPQKQSSIRPKNQSNALTQVLRAFSGRTRRDRVSAKAVASPP